MGYLPRQPIPAWEPTRGHECPHLVAFRVTYGLTCLNQTGWQLPWQRDYTTPGTCCAIKMIRELGRIRRSIVCREVQNCVFGSQWSPPPAGHSRENWNLPFGTLDSRFRGSDSCAKVSFRGRDGARRVESCTCLLSGIRPDWGVDSGPGIAIV